MSFRGISLEPIHRNIQLRLEELRQQHSYEAPSFDGPKDFSQETTPLVIGGFTFPEPDASNHYKLSKKTCWYSLRSNAVIADPEDPEAYIEPQFARMGPKWDMEAAEAFANDVDGWKQRSSRPDFANTPPPGVESISISTKGAMGSIKTADVKLRVFHANDMEHIERAYLMPGITLFLEWGWSGTEPIGDIAYKGARGKSSTKLEQMIVEKKLGLGATDNIVLSGQTAQTNEEALGNKPGQYDGMLGVITKFNWSLDSDGSYSVNISIISPNSLVMGIQLETHVLNATRTTGYIWDKRKKKYRSTTKRGPGGTRLTTSTSTAISDGEMLLRVVSKLMNEKDQSMNKYPVETSLGIQAAIKSLNNEKAQNAKELEEMAYNEQQAEDAKTFATIKKNSPMSHGGGPEDLFPGSEWQMKQDRRIAQFDAELKEVLNFNSMFETMLEKRNTQIDSDLKELDKSLNATKDSKGTTTKTEAKITSESFVIKGEGDNAPIYFAADSQGYLGRLLNKSNQIYHAFENLAIFNRTKGRCRYLLAPPGTPDATYKRNGILATYEWQEGANAVELGAVLACRGWIKKEGKGYNEADYVSWRWIEDYLLMLCAPKNDNGEPVISLSSTHIGNEIDSDVIKYFPNQCLNHPLILSMDPKVCMLSDKQSSEAVGKIKEVLPAESQGTIDEPGDIARFLPTPTQTGPNQITTFGNHSTGNIRDILVNTDHVISVLNSQRSFEGFVTTLLSDINDACGKPWDFTLQAGEADSHVLQVVDRNLIENRNTWNTINPCIANRASLSHQETDPALKTSKHYTFKGKGIGNILKTVSMQSKLPKSIASMAFISNKNAAKNTSDPSANSFNIYGERIIDSFYSGNLGAKTVKRDKQVEDMASKKANLYQDWVTTYNAQFLPGAATEKKESLNGRQIQKQMVNTVVFGHDEFVIKPENAPRLLPLNLSLSMDGISGLYQGNSLKLLTVQEGGVLPNRYKDSVIFQITKVNQGISDSGWTTNVECLMRMLPKEER